MQNAVQLPHPMDLGGTVSRSRKGKGGEWLYTFVALEPELRDVISAAAAVADGEDKQALSDIRTKGGYNQTAADALLLSIEGTDEALKFPGSTVGIFSEGSDLEGAAQAAFADAGTNEDVLVYLQVTGVRIAEHALDTVDVSKRRYLFPRGDAVTTD